MDPPIVRFFDGQCSGLANAADAQREDALTVNINCLVGIDAGLQ
jgi:hypothetical protein